MIKILIWRAFLPGGIFSFAETPQALYKYGDTSLLLCKDPYAITINDFYYE